MAAFQRYLSELLGVFFYVLLVGDVFNIVFIIQCGLKGVLNVTGNFVYFYKLLEFSTVF